MWLERGLIGRIATAGGLGALERDSNSKTPWVGMPGVAGRATPKEQLRADGLGATERDSDPKTSHSRKPGSGTDIPLRNRERGLITRGSRDAYPRTIGMGGLKFLGDH